VYVYVLVSNEVFSDTEYINAWEVELTSSIVMSDDQPPNNDTAYLFHGDQDVYCMPDNKERGQGVGAEEELNHYKGPPTKTSPPAVPGVSSSVVLPVGDGVGYPSLDQVPADVSSLSVEEVLRCLRWLNLHKYVDKFRAELVDGQILMNVDQQVLIEDFGFRRIEAIRLERFARHGWKPFMDRASPSQRQQQQQQPMQVIYLQPEPLYTDV